MRIAVLASVAVVLVAAIAVGSLQAVKYLGKDQPIVVITDDTVGISPGSTGQTAQSPGGVLATLGAGNEEWGADSTMWAVRADGSLWAWGYDPFSPDSFARVGSDTDWVAADVDGSQYLALKSDGSLWAWGETIGDNWTGFTSVFRSPARVGSDTGWMAVATGADRRLAVSTDGSLWVWDTEAGSTINTSPTRLGSDTDWVAVAAGGGYFVALKSDGSLWEWGVSYSIDSSSPTRVGSDTDWVAISAGGSHSLAMKSDGSLWEWGMIAGAPTAEGTTYLDSPTRVGSDTDWVAISAGDAHSLALKSDGSLWAWGDNLWGRLGDGTSTTRTLPTLVGSDADWVAVAAGYSQSLAQKADGSLWAWGENFGRVPQQVLAAAETTEEAGDSAYTFNWLQNYPRLLDPANDVMIMKVTSPSPSYWRANALETFTGNAWTAVQAFLERLEPTRSGDSYVYSVPEVAPTPPGLTVSQSFQVQSVYTNYLFVGGDPRSFRIDQDLALRTNDVRALHSNKALGPTLAYRVTAVIPDLKPTDVVGKGSDYPQALDRYLGLPFLPASRIEGPDQEASWRSTVPDSFPGGGEWVDLYALNREIIGEATDPYEVTLRIERYLRNFFEYSLTPPSSDYSSPYSAFLFDTRSGYCQHFAGAMALLLRYNGIPARVAVGFTSGELDESSPDTYTVSTNNAHAWVEVYFPQIGWVAFDPTPGLEHTIPTPGASSTSPGFVNPFGE